MPVHGAFVQPASALAPACSPSRQATSTRPLHVSSFLPRRSYRYAKPSWAVVLRRSPAAPHVVRAPFLASLQTKAPQKILISGAPASGKGTQCESIVSRYGVVHISTGDMLRAAVKSGSQLGMEAKSYMDAGELVPDSLVISMLKERITQPDVAANGWLLDGFPRTAVQAEALTSAGISPSAVIVLDVADDVLIERVVGRRSDPQTGKIYHVKFNPPTDPEVAARLTQRSDDTEEKAKVRLETYYKHAQSIQDHYSEMTKKVDGNRDRSVVFEDIAALIDTPVGSDDEDSGGTDSSSGAAISGGTIAEASESTRSMPVSEFVRRAEEAYERGVLMNEDVNWSGQAGVDTPESAGTSTYADLGRRLDLVFGDVFSLLAFAYIGRSLHGDNTVDFEVLKTAGPFVVAWLGTAPLLGAYTRTATQNLPAALAGFARAWAIAVPMGIGLRGVLTDHVPPAAFAVVTLVSTFVVVGSWRVAYVKIRGDETNAERRGGLIDGFNMITNLLKRW